MAQILGQPCEFQVQEAGHGSGGTRKRCQTEEVQTQARQLQRAKTLGRGPAAREVGRQTADVQEEAGTWRAQQRDDDGAGGEVGRARLRLGAPEMMRV